MKNIVEKIVVVGGDIAGLVAAYDLANDIPEARILVLNQGKFIDEDGTDFAEGTGNHTHILSEPGVQMLYTKFPGSQKLLDDAGAPVLEWGGKNVRVVFSNGDLTQNHPFLETRSMTKSLLKRVIMTYIRQMPQIMLVEDVKVTDLIMGKDRAMGVEVLTKSNAELNNWFVGQGSQRYVYADKTVLAMGSSKDLRKWLEKFMIMVPAPKIVNANLTYVSANLRGVNFPNPIQMMASGNKTNCAMVLAQVEGKNAYKGTIFYYNLQNKPKTSNEFMRLMIEVCPEVSSALSTAEVLDDKVYVYGNCSSQMNQFWDVVGWPDDLFVIGKGFVDFNPRYGQAMTIAMWEASILAEEVAWGTAQSYNERVKTLTEFPWTMATGGDYAILRKTNPQLAPDQTLKEKFGQMYMEHLIKIAGGEKNWPVAKAFFEVSNMKNTGGALASPEVLRQVLLPWF